MPTPTPSMSFFPTGLPTTNSSLMAPIEIVATAKTLAFVPFGKDNGERVESLEEELTDVFKILAPQILDEVLESNGLVANSIQALRQLQASDEDEVAVQEPITVDVIEVECLVGGQTSDMCVKVTIEVPIINLPSDLAPQYVAELEDAYTTALIQALDDGSVKEVNPDLVLIPYIDPAATEEPTATPADTTPTNKEPSDTGSQTPRPSLRGTLSPTKAPTRTPTGTTRPTTSSTVAVSPTVTCEDENTACQELEAGYGSACVKTQCAALKEEGECISSAELMIQKCRNSCNFCGLSEVPSAPTTSPTPEEVEEPTDSVEPTDPVEPTDSVEPEEPTDNIKPTEPVAPTEAPVCEDINPQCLDWALQNECNNNPGFMLLNCKDACGLCGCQDKNQECFDLLENTGECRETKCEKWSSDGECNTNVEYMTLFCKNSCNRCDDTSENACRDNEIRCAGWASEGECAANPNYMQVQCAKSCGFC